MYIQPVIWLICFYHYTSFIFALVYLYTYFLPRIRILCLSLRLDPGLGSGRGLQHHQSHCDLLGQGPGCGMTSVVTNENIQKGFGITVHTRCFCWNSWGMLRDLCRLVYRYMRKHIYILCKLYIYNYIHIYIYIYSNWWPKHDWPCGFYGNAQRNRVLTGVFFNLKQTFLCFHSFLYYEALEVSKALDDDNLSPQKISDSEESEPEMSRKNLKLYFFLVNLMITAGNSHKRSPKLILNSKLLPKTGWTNQWFRCIRTPFRRQNAEATGCFLQGLPCGTQFRARVRGWTSQWEVSGVKYFIVRTYNMI